MSEALAAPVDLARIAALLAPAPLPGRPTRLVVVRYTRAAANGRDRAQLTLFDPTPAQAARRILQGLGFTPAAAVSLAPAGGRDFASALLLARAPGAERAAPVAVIGGLAAAELQAALPAALASIPFRSLQP